MSFERPTASPGGVERGKNRLSILGWVRRNLLHSLGIVMTLLVVLVAILAPTLSPQDPTLQDAKIRLKAPMWAEDGSSEFPLGTDQLGRDLLSRIFFGARVSLIVAVCAVFLAGMVGVILGLISGYLEGRTETFIMGIADAQLAFPSILLAVAIIVVLRPTQCSAPTQFDYLV